MIKKKLILILMSQIAVCGVLNVICNIEMTKAGETNVNFLMLYQ